jgi:organic radical activating enzyme
MGNYVNEIASAFKVAYHEEKFRAYLQGEPIFPATLELDITSECTRKCSDCPSSRGSASQHLEMEFIERLFACLEGQTRGLLLTGGEPTAAPTFPKVLSMARRFGFVDVAVVTNGSLLDNERVQEALTAYASTVRVSMYDWSPKSCGGLAPTLKRIEALRARIDREGSKLEIGVSALTSSANAATLAKVADFAQSAGAHWIYFHPMCTGWNSGFPACVEQEGVLAKIKECQMKHVDGFRVFVSQHRYKGVGVDFDGYHAAHFLLVVGADGVNYLGAEVKYQPQHAIANVANRWQRDFLWQRERLRRIKSVSSQTYPALGSRHRGVLYNGFIERLKRGEGQLTEASFLVSPDTFKFPHIL